MPWCRRRGLQQLYIASELAPNTTGSTRQDDRFAATRLQLVKRRTTPRPRGRVRIGLSWATKTDRGQVTGNKGQELRLSRCHHLRVLTFHMLYKCQPAARIVSRRSWLL